ncbi:HNH endonuclease [Gordonia phage Malisha]|nr:HNH endonuclease [Gordonia phage Malisha]
MNVRTSAGAGNTPEAWPNLCERFDVSDGSAWRWCPQCGEHKRPDEFYADTVRKNRARPTPRVKCRQCTRAQMRARYADRSKFVDELKLSSGCVDCGWAVHPRALEFDHLPGSGKVQNIAHMVANTTYSLDDIKAEIAKCEVVCANCHRIRTYDRAHGNTDWDLRLSNRTPEEIGRRDDPPPFQQLTLEV